MKKIILKSILSIFLFNPFLLHSKIFLNSLNSFRSSKTTGFSQKYLKVIKKSDLKYNNGKSKSFYIWQEYRTQLFTELILSWNAFRPQQGSFSFFIAVKHNNWSKWYKIAEWSSNRQLTFVNTRDPFVHAKHVRIELQKGRKAKAFKIKVVANGGANINKLKALFVCLADWTRFRRNLSKFDKPSTLIRGVPKVSQWDVKHLRRKDFCSPTSISMLLGYFAHKKYFPWTFGNHITNDLPNYINEFASKVHDDSYLDIYGAWPLNVAQVFDSSYGRLFCRVERLNDINDLYYYLKKQIPVAISVRGKLRGAFKLYNNGHFIVVIGWNKEKDTLLCVDPAFVMSSKLLRAYNRKDVLYSWGTSRNLAYIVTPVKRI